MGRMVLKVKLYKFAKMPTRAHETELVILTIALPELEQVEELEETERGDGGFGSTGR